MSPLTPAAFARQKSVNRSTVSRWIASGRIQLDDSGLIDAAAAETTLAGTGSLLPHHVARVEQAQQQRELGLVADDVRPATPATAAATPAATAEPTEAMRISQRLNTARAEREEEQGQIVRMERMQKAKLLIPRGDVERVMDDIGRFLGDLLERLPDRYTSEVLSHNGDPKLIHATLAGAGRDIRKEIAHLLRRRAEELL